MKKITTKIEAVNDEGVINEEYLNTTLDEEKGHISYIGKNITNEFKYYERCNGEVRIEKARKTTIQKVYAKRLFDNYDNANEVLKNYLLMFMNRKVSKKSIY